MCSGHQSQAVVVVERFRYVLAKRIPSTPWTYPPAAPVIWIAPQQITHRSFMRHFLNPIKGSYIVQRINARGKPSMQAEDLVVYKGGQG